VPFPARDAVEYLVAPESTRIWFAHFLADRDRGRVRFLGEDPETVPPDRLAGLDPASTRLVVFYSAHETLDRDDRIAAALREQGHAVLSQSPLSVRLGVDKFAMKRFFDEHAIPTPPWVCGGGFPMGFPADGPVVVKARGGTQSRDMRLVARSALALGPHEFAEPYLDGIEYSVLVYRDAFRHVVFPPVWKGANGRDLTPPWRRLRLCPFPGLSPELDGRLRSSALGIADAAQTLGFVEVEYLVVADGRELVLEINPRVSGTMRIAALATDVPVFSVPNLPDLVGALPAQRYAAETPHSGPPFIDAAAGVYATSRLTVVADDLPGLHDRLRERSGVAFESTH
jgi:hypothetical protein